MNKDWLSLVPISDGFTYNATILCEDCAVRIAKELKETTDNQNDLPQGPYPYAESDYPQHCSNGSNCVNAVQVPNGQKIGCPLSCSLTEDGIEFTRRSIAEYILFGSPHQKATHRLWWHIFQSSLNHSPILRIVYSFAHFPQVVRKALPDLSTNNCRLQSEVFTDLEHIYGCAISRDKGEEFVILWRLGINSVGKLITPADLVQLPKSEIVERSLEDIFSEAISECAWD